MSRLLAGAVLGLLSVGSVQADDSGSHAYSPNSSAVEVRVGAVVANNSGRECDPRLVVMRKQFDALFPYTSYRLVKEERQRVPWGGQADFDIPGGRYVLVIPKEFKNGRVAMRVLVIEGTRSIVETTLSLRNHATLLVGGPRQPDGVLILAIGADTVAQ